MVTVPGTVSCGRPQSRAEVLGLGKTETEGNSNIWSCVFVFFGSSKKNKYF